MKLRVFDIIQSMENVWNMEWKKLSMEWKGRYRWIWSIKNFYSILFHSIACPACHCPKNYNFAQSFETWATIAFPTPVRYGYGSM